MYAYGLRNPWRFSFDRTTGDLWIGDVGQDHWEEIDHLTAGTPAGTNFGWSYYEGTHVFKAAADQPRRACSVPAHPVPAHVASGPGNCAVTGGYVYRGTILPRCAASTSTPTSAPAGSGSGARPAAARC